MAQSCGTLVVEETAPDWWVGNLGLESLVGEFAYSATLLNNGDAKGTVDVVVSADGAEVDRQTFTLNPGDSIPVTGSVSLASGSYNVVVEAGDDSVSGTVTVQEQAVNEPNFTVSGLSLEGGTSDLSTPTRGFFEYGAEVRNTGDGDGTALIDVLVDGEVFDSYSVFIPAGDRVSIGDEIDGPQGEHTVTVQVNGDEVSGTVFIEYNVDIVINSLSYNVSADAVIVRAKFTSGSARPQAGEVPIEMRLNNEVRHSETIFMEAGETIPEQDDDPMTIDKKDYNLGPPPSDPVDIFVQIGDETRSITLDVADDGTGGGGGDDGTTDFSLVTHNLSVTSPNVGEVLVEGEIENTGADPGNFVFDVAIDGTLVQDQSPAINGNERLQVSRSFTGLSGDVEVLAVLGDEQTAQTINVEEDTGNGGGGDDGGALPGDGDLGRAALAVGGLAAGWFFLAGDDDEN